MAHQFTGAFKVKVLEASDLRAVDTPGGGHLSTLDPYALVQFDDVVLGQTTAASKSMSPIWNETFDGTVQHAKSLEVMIFHKSLLQPHPFIASVRVPLDQVIAPGTESKKDVWLNLEPAGKVHLVVQYTHAAKSQGGRPGQDSPCGTGGSPVRARAPYLGAQTLRSIATHCRSGAAPYASASCTR